MKLSVVTPSLNQARYLRETLESVLSQGYNDLEYIVIDGGSSDGSVDILREFGPRLSHWVSEADKGQAEAINKGFSLATGDVFAWINSDDYYLPGAFFHVMGLFAKHEVDIVRSGVRHILKTEDCVLHDHVPRESQLRSLRTHDPIVQPGVFWKRSLHEKVGPLRVDLKYCLDWEFFVRLFESGSHVNTSRITAVYRIHDSHKTGIGGEERNAEVLALLRRIAPDYYRTVRHLSDPDARIWQYEDPRAQAWGRRFPFGLRLVRLRNFLLNRYPVYRAWMLVEQHRAMSRT